MGGLNPNVQMVFHTTDFDPVACQVFQSTGHLGVDLISKLLGTEERAAVLGREKRMNQQVREGLAHRYITRQNGVLFIQKRPPFQGESGTAGLPRAKAPDFAKLTSRLAFWRHPPQDEGRHSVATAAGAILWTPPSRGALFWLKQFPLPHSSTRTSTMCPPKPWPRRRTNLAACDG